MNPFTEHTQQQGVTYLQHWCFAMGIAYRLLSSVIAFALHAMFPFIDIERRLDLEATAAFMNERNDWIESAKKNGAPEPKAKHESDDRSTGRLIANICMRTFMLFV